MKPEAKQSNLARAHRIHALWMAGKTTYQIADAEGTSISNACTYVLRARKLGLCPVRPRKIVPKIPNASPSPDFRLPAGIVLFARFKGTSFEAETTPEGIRVPGLGEFTSLSNAAMKCVETSMGERRNLNGWDFWRVRLANGQECFASHLRADPSLLNQIAHP